MKLSKRYLRYCQRSNRLFRQLEESPLTIGEKEEVEALIVSGRAKELDEAERRIFSQKHQGQEIVYQFGIIDR